jgi:mannan endo-1,4-beta-mannosidase
MPYLTPRCVGLLSVVALTCSFLPSRAQSIRLEAEDAQLVGDSLRIMPEQAVSAAAHTDYSGRGYVTGFHQLTDHLVFHVEVKQAGIYNLAISYRTPNRRDYDISVNDSGVSGTLLPTPETYFWTAPAGKIELNAGDNIITINRGWGYFDLDYIELKPAPPPLPPLAVTTPPVDAKITLEARALLSRLDASYGKTTALGVYRDEDASYVVAKTGVRPAMMGGDLDWYMSYFLKKQPLQGDEVGRLIADYKSGQMITICWHWPSPFGALDTAEKPWWRAFYTDSTTFDVTRAVDPTTPEHTAAIADIDALAVQLRRLQDAHVPVLWRPLHEGQGGWFWWGAKGPEPYKQLWYMLYDRLVNVQGIHNLLWVYDGVDPSWYPGDSKVDLVAVDAYPPNIHDPESALWDLLQQQFDGRKPLLMNEFGGVPDVPRMQRLGVYWLYAFSWSNQYALLGPQKNTIEELNRIYKSPGVVTLPAPIQSSSAPSPVASNP